MLSPKPTDSLILTRIGEARSTLATGHSSLLFAVFEQTTRRAGAAGINRILARLDVLDHAVLVNHERGTVGETMFLIQNAVGLRNGSLKVAQKGEIDVFLLGKGAVGGRAVDADAQNLGSILLEFGDISLIRLQLLRSTTGEGEYIERQHYVLLSGELTKRNLVAVLIGQSEVWGLVANSQRPGLRPQRARQR